MFVILREGMFCPKNIPHNNQGNQFRPDFRISTLQLYNRTKRAFCCPHYITELTNNIFHFYNPVTNKFVSICIDNCKTSGRHASHIDQHWITRRLVSRSILTDALCIGDIKLMINLEQFCQSVVVMLTLWKVQ